MVTDAGSLRVHHRTQNLHLVILQQLEVAAVEVELRDFVRKVSMQMLGRGLTS